MPTLDARPGALDVLVYPGNAVGLRLNWPVGTDLADDGRTFTADADGHSLDVEVDGRTVTVTFSGSITAALAGGRPIWRLIETTAGQQVRLTGRVLPTSTPTEAQDIEINITESNVEIEIDVLGEPGPRGLPGPSSLGYDADLDEVYYDPFVSDGEWAALEIEDGQPVAVTQEA